MSCLTQAVRVTPVRASANNARSTTTRLCALDRRHALALLPLALVAAGQAQAEELGFEPAKKPAVLEYTTLEESYKEKDETAAGDVGRFAAFMGMFALVTAYLASSPTEIARRIENAKRADEAELMSSPLYAKYKKEWAEAVKLARDKSV